MISKRIEQWQLPTSVQRMGLEIISVLLPIGLYAIVLSNPIPADIPLNLRFALAPGIPIFAALLFFAFQLKGYLGRTLSLSLTLLLFALPLAALWNTGISSGFTIGGLLPWTDANVYYWDARLLLQGEPLFPNPDYQRPLATGLLATLLWLTQQNLQVTIALLVFIAAITCFLASRALQRSHGTLAAVFLLVGIYAFYRTFAGSVMTENLGLSLGCLGFAALWYGASSQRIIFVLAGLFFFSLGMNARISAIFILPAIVLWGIHFFGHNQKFSWRFALNGTGTILIAFVLHGVLRKLIAAPGPVPFSNFSYTLYGILTGNNWLQILQNHPELDQMGGAERSWRAYELCWQVFRENPFRLLTGILRGWREFFAGDLSPFLIDTPRSNLDFWLEMILLLGLFACWRKPEKTHSLLTLCLGLGVFLSIPLLPIWDAGLRPYATVIVVFYAILALGLAFLAEQLSSFFHRQGWTLEHRNWLHKIFIPASTGDRAILSTRLSIYSPLWFGLLITLFCTVAPVAIKATHSSLSPLQNTCPPPLEARYYRISPGSSINLVRDKVRESSRIPNIRIGDFRQGLKSMAAYSEERYRAFKALSPGHVLVDTFGYSWLVAKRSIVPKKTGAIVACGTLEQYSALDLFKAQSIQLLSP